MRQALQGVGGEEPRVILHCGVASEDQAEEAEDPVDVPGEEGEIVEVPAGDERPVGDQLDHRHHLRRLADNIGANMGRHTTVNNIICWGNLQSCSCKGSTTTS